MSTSINTESAVDASGSFDEAVTTFLSEVLEEHPATATFLGLTEHDHRLSDHSAEAIARREAANASWLGRFDAFHPDSLTAEQQTDRALLLAKLGADVATADFTGWRRNPTNYLENGVYELFAHGNRPEAEAVEAAIARLARVPDILEAGRQNLDPTLMDAALTTQWGVPNVRSQVAFMRHGLATFVGDPTLVDRLQHAGDEAAQAYEAFAEHVEQLATKATGSYAYGEERYDAILRTGEVFEFGATDVLQMGRDQMEILDAQMSELAHKIGGTKDWRHVMNGLRDRHPSSMDHLLTAYRDETAKARAFVERTGIVALPDGESCRVEPSPIFRRASAPVASYFPPAYYGPPSSGTFNVPFTPDGASEEEQEQRLRSNSFFEIPGITAHEAYPGHHLHFAAAQGTSALRHIYRSTYMTEGWGLYVEKMMGEQGYYETGEAKLGQLSMRNFRAGRMVVDTSLHLGQMTMDEATTFMTERCGFPERTAHGEVLRYCAWPTQASAYLTGAIEIERLAARWLEQGKGTLPEFHWALLSSGMLPLGVAAQAIGLC